MRQQSGFTVVEFAILLVAILGIGGWVSNIVQIVNHLSDPITGMFILRCVGIFVAPLGAVLGFIW